MRRQKKYGPNERTEQNSRKRLKQNGDKQSIRYRVQNTGYKDAQGIQWVLQQHKKDPGKNEDYTKWNKNLQGVNSGVDVAENQINDLEHKEEKNIQSEQQEEKRIHKSEKVRSLWDNFKHSNIQIIGVPEEKRKNVKLKTNLKK